MDIKTHPTKEFKDIITFDDRAEYGLFASVQTPYSWGTMRFLAKNQKAYERDEFPLTATVPSSLTCAAFEELAIDPDHVGPVRSEAHLEIGRKLSTYMVNVCSGVRPFDTANA